MYRLASQYRATGDGGFGFLFGMLVMGAVGGLMESAYLQPMFVPFVAACGIGQVAFRRFDVSNRPEQNGEWPPAIVRGTN